MDDLFFLYLIGSSLPQRFEKITVDFGKTWLWTVTGLMDCEVHLIFDEHLTPSIKDCERQNRQESYIP